MEQRRIGALRVSVLGLGCNNFGWRLDYDQTVPVVEAALAAGINFFDTADIYGGTESEEVLRPALGQRRGEGVPAPQVRMRGDRQRPGAPPAFRPPAAAGRPRPPR